MLKSVCIASRDDRCLDCKLTAKFLRVRGPTWWQRWFQKAKPVIEIITEVWYGRDIYWSPGPCQHIILDRKDCAVFQRLWKLHCEEKEASGLMGPYRTIFRKKAGKWGLKDSTKL